MKNKFSKSIIFLIILTIIISVFSVSAYAIEGSYDGSGTGGGSSHATKAKGGYSINQTKDAYKNIIGYRFTVFDTNSHMELGKIIDVYNNSWNVYGKNYPSLHSASRQYSKVMYYRLYKNGSFSFNTNGTPSSNGFKTYLATNYTALKNMPQNPSNLKSWIENSNTNAKIYELCDISSSNISKNTVILVEPIIQVKLGGMHHALTTTEIAIYGGIYKGFSYSANTSSDIGFINNFLCMHFPNLLYYTNSLKVSGVSASIAGAKSLSSRISYGKIVEKGYGLGVFTPNDAIINRTVKFIPQVSGANNSNHTVSNGATITLNAAPKTNQMIWAGWYDDVHRDMRAAGSKEVINSNHNYWGQCSPYSVKFSDTGKVVKWDLKCNGVYAYTSNAISLPTKTQTGYKFLGWSTTNPANNNNIPKGPFYSGNIASNSQNAIDIRAKANSSGVTTLYPVFVPYTVYYDVNFAGTSAKGITPPINLFSASMSGSEITYNSFQSKIDIGALNKGTYRLSVQYAALQKGTYYLTIVSLNEGKTIKGKAAINVTAYDSIFTGSSTFLSKSLPTGTSTVGASKEINGTWNTLVITLNVTENFSGGSYAVFLTKGTPVTSQTYKDYTAVANQYITTNTDFVNKNACSYICVPGATNAVKTSASVAKPFGYTFNTWKNGSADATTKTTLTSNITLKANWKVTNYEIRYDANGGTWDTSCADENYVYKTVNGTGYYYGKDPFTIETEKLITVPSGTLASLHRDGYKHPNNADWKVSHNGKTYKGGDKAAIKDLISGLSGNVVTIAAQWEPITYNLTFWTDLGPNKEYSSYISSGYKSYTDVKWGKDVSSSLPFCNSYFRKAGDTQKLEYDKAANINKSLFIYSAQTFNGWYAYRESDGKYAVLVGQEIKWYSANEIKDNNLKLHVFTDCASVKNLTTANGDTIRMFASQNYPDNQIPTTTLTDNKYKIYYCGESSTSNSYGTENIVTEKCQLSSQDNTVYADQATYVFNLLSLSNKKTIKANKFSRTGYHYDNNALWIVSRKNGSTTEYLTSTNTDATSNAAQWTNDKNNALLLKDLSEVRNLTFKNDEILYAHLQWAPNTYKIVYCGNKGADSSEDYSSYVDPTFNKSLTAFGTTCNAGGTAKDYLHCETLKYDSTYTLYDCRYVSNKVGYRFYGWSLNPNQSYAKADGIYTSVPIEDTCFDSENTTKAKNYQVKNLTTKDNDVVYLYAVWGPIQYQVKYSDNSSYASGTMTGSMSNGVYKPGTSTVANWCFYDKEYVLRPNEFNSKNSVFVDWTIKLGSEILKTNVQDSTVVNKLITGDKLSKLVTTHGETVTAEAQWGAETTVYYNISLINPTDIYSNKGIKIDTNGYLVEKDTAKKINSYKLTLNAKPDELNQSFPLLNIDKDLGINNKQGYTFNGWKTTKELGVGEVLDENISILNLRTKVGKIDNYANEQITLYQDYTLNKYKVYYCGNGATEEHYGYNVTTEPHNGIMCECGKAHSNVCSYYNHYDDTDREYNTPFALEENKFYKEGYIFMGWATYPNGPVKYTDKETVNIPTGDNDIVWLYAVWAPTHVYYNLNLPTDVSSYACLNELNENGLTMFHGGQNNTLSSYNICNKTDNQSLVKYQIVPSVFVPISYTALVKNENGLDALKDYKLVGWSKNPNSRPGDSDIIYPNQEYGVKTFIEKYFDNFSTENCLYAVWAQSSIQIQYRVEDSKHYSSLNDNYKINSENYITKNNSVYTNVLKNATIDSTYTVLDISNFGKTHKSDVGRYSGWELHKIINNQEYYLTESANVNEQWKPVDKNSTVRNDAYIFDGGYEISNKEAHINFETICGSELVDGNVTIVFVATCEVVTNPLTIKYVVNTSDVINSSDYGSTSAVNISAPYVINNNFVALNTEGEIIDYSQTINVPSGSGNVREQSIKILDTSIVSRDYYHVSYWTYFSADKDSTNTLEPGTVIKNTDDLVQELKNKSNDGVIVLYAHWVPNRLIVRFSPDGGVLTASETNTYIDNDIIYNKESSQPIEKAAEYSALLGDEITLDISSMSFNMIKNHFSRGKGWKYNDAIYSDAFTADKTILKDGDKVIVLKAVWNPNIIKIVYHVNDGIITNGSYILTDDNEDAVCIKDSGKMYTQVVEWAASNVSSPIDNPAKFGLVKSNFSFKSWNTARDGSGLTLVSDDTWNPFNYYQDNGQTIHLYAQWEPAKYTINYCGNGADGEGYSTYIQNNPGIGLLAKSNTDDKAYDCNRDSCNYNYYSLEAHSHATPFSLTPNMFTKTGYVFSHWVDEDGKVYDDNAIVDFTEKHLANPDKPIFLYAVWEEISYTIVFDGNNETDGFVNDQYFVYNQSAALNDNNYIKDYYHFDETKCWIATRIVNSKTLTCVDYNNGTAVWKDLAEDTVNKPYLFKDNEIVKNLTVIDDDEITMTAQWIPNKLVVKSNANGGNVQNDFTVDSNSLINKNATAFEQNYTYNPDNLYLSLYADNYFGMYKSSDDSSYAFNGWSLEKDQTVDFDAYHLSNVSVLSLAESLIDEELVEVTLYASWGVEREDVLQYWEGEDVSYNDIVKDIQQYCKGGTTFDYLYGGEDEDFIVYDTKHILSNLSEIDSIYSIEKDSKNDYISRFDNGSDKWRLYTYFNNLEPHQTAHLTTSYVANEKPYALAINIIYNNPPEIEACDRWFTIEEARAGKITELELLRTAIATDAESDVSNALKVKDFDASIFKNPGEYEVTYTVTDNIPANGYHKTTEKTVIIHVVENYSNTHARFINNNFYVYSTLNADSNTDIITTLYAKKINGVLYFTDENGTFINDENGNPYPVDSGFKTSSKIMVNSKGIYTIIPLSKWYRNENYIVALRECLNNKKDENGNWERIEETWFFKSEDIKAIKENIKENVIDPNFYSNQFANGHCVSYTNKADIAINSSDINQEMNREDIALFDMSNGVVAGFKNDESVETWNKTYDSILFIPTTIDTQKVSRISGNAFNSNDIRTVYIPNDTVIEDDAFVNCPNLKFAYIGENCVFYEDSFPENTVVIKVNYNSFK